MGAKSSSNGETAPPRSVLIAFEKRRQRAAERMFRNHYNKKHSNILSSHSEEECRRSEFDDVRKLAFTDTETHRGLRNLAGENNCFLNATIQALWHLGPFRYQMQKAMSMNKGTTKEEGEKLGLFDALCNLFIQYQYTELKILPPTELRTTMSELFDQFQLGKIADANETLEAILETIHVECTPSCTYRKHNCLAHTVFGGLLMEQSTCLHCSSRSAPMLRSDFVHYVYAAELIALGEMDAESRKQKGAKKIASKYPLKKFGHLLHECMGVSPRCCPSLDDRISSKVKDGVDTEQGTRSDQRSSKKCDGKATVKLYALEPPMALAISVGWTQSRESPETLHSLLSLMSYTIELSDLFDLSKQSEHGEEIHSSVSTCNETTQDLDRSKSSDVLDLTQEDANMTHITESLEGAMDQSSSENKNSADSPLPSVYNEEKQAFSRNPSYVFRGFVCYYGLHYISILQESNNGEARFLLFDDQKVRPIGGWEDVKKECMKSLYQPVLLLYELQDSNTPAERLSHPHSSLPSRPHPDGVPETKESGSRNLCSSSSSSSSSSSTTRYRVSDMDATASISALHTSAERHHATAVTSSSSRPCASYSGKHHVPPLMAIKTFEKRFVTSYVALEYEKSKKRKLLGFLLDIDASSGQIVITGFHPHPETGKMLPAEASGQISLCDQLLAIDNIAVENYSRNKATRIFEDLGLDSSKKTVLLTLRSAHNTEVWYRCPYCDMDERLTKAEEYRLREIYEHVLPKDFNEGTMLGDSLVEGEKSILTQCRTCMLRGSARKLLESNIFS